MGRPAVLSLAEAREWFSTQVTLGGAFYTLDDEQLAAVIDLHKNTLVTARAGSGKTRVIVAKIVYLVAICGYDFDEIQVFMFNRTAATEVNERVQAVQIGGIPLTEYNNDLKPSDRASNSVAKVASTFHKFAYDLLRRGGLDFRLVNESLQQTLIKKSLDTVLGSSKPRASLNRERYDELLKIIGSFIVRAGQKYPDGSPQLDQAFTSAEQLGFRSYQQYLDSLQPPNLDFNMLMNQAAKLLTSTPHEAVQKLRYLIVDEYQDFSFLFWQLMTAIRHNAPAAHLFVVGDDWQMINRFAGSEVEYFMNFGKIFPEDCHKLPISTNYRSTQAVVETANRFMLSHYDAAALSAKAFSQQRGRVKWLNYARTRFNARDILEDGRGDGRFVRALAEATGLTIRKVPLEAARLLKTCYRLVKHHAHQSIMLLHRHNFTSFLGVELERFYQALGRVCIDSCVLGQDQYHRQVRAMTMHKSKGLEAEVVLLLEFDRSLLLGHHPHAELFPHLGDSRASEKADQERLIYVALTRAKERLYLLSKDKRSLLEL